ncbi:MAG: YgiQ family radical SAM protein [Deltaproteobacteria bacterium]|nr:YgiQ family radical SAM protein [Deltaproteobacteria bacterium]
MSEPSLYGRRKYWAKRFGPAPVLPMSRKEMDELGWDSCDIIVVSGDAYVDHPSFGMALIGRVLEAQGFRVGIIAQPDWQSPAAFSVLGRPNLMFGVTSGNMDSMVNRYTADGRRRSDDAYSPDQQPDLRPDRAVIAYCNRCRQAYSGVPIVAGGIEASLRRVAHYDYWSDKVRRSILLDAKADMLIYGNAERAVVEVAHRLAAAEEIADIKDVRGTVFARPTSETGREVVRLPAYDIVAQDPLQFARATRLVFDEADPVHGRALVQQHAKRDVFLLPPAVPLSTKELDQTYELPFTRCPHPAYKSARLKAWEMIRHSVTIMRGCFGGCSFCALACHAGPIIQSRSEESILREIKQVRDNVPGFTGIISDLGGPTANMYRQGCLRDAQQKKCQRLSCLYPSVCRQLQTSHLPLIKLYRRARKLRGIKKILIGSGVRYDLALRSSEYVKELVGHHVGGYLKIAPEHVCPGPLAHMQKPDVKLFERFKGLFEKHSAEASKEQYLVPYFIAAHPGTTDEDMLELAQWLKKHDFRIDQAQTFLPTPMSLATAMYHSGINPLKPFKDGGVKVKVPRGLRARRLHKAFLRYHDPVNWPLLRKALKRMGREDLIGNGKRHLVPSWQPGRGRKNESRPSAKRKKRTRR